MTYKTPKRRLLLGLVLAAATSVAVPLSAQAKTPEIVAVVKLTGIPWFNRFQVGVEAAGKDLGVHATQAGPAQPDPAQQVKIIEDQIARKVDAIVVVPDDANVLQPVLERARAAGIVVVTQESPGQKGADWDVETIDNKAFAEQIFKSFAEHAGGKGEFALYVGSLTVPLHNAWADIGLAYFKEHYPDLKPVADRFPVGESVDDSFRTAQELLQTHPDLKGLIGFGSQGPIGFAQALQRNGVKSGKVTVVGTVLPAQAEPFLKKGLITEGFLWDPKDAGYATVAIAKRVIDKQAVESGLELPGLGKADVDAATHTVRFNAIKTFSAENAAAFGF